MIAKVHGTATAAGCQLVAACDLAIAVRDRALRDSGSEGRAVLLDADGAVDSRDRPSTRAPDAVHGHTDRRTHCLDWGLVNEVVAADDLDDAVESLADGCCSSARA